MNIADLATWAVCGVAGLALGLASFYALRINTALYLSGGVLRSMGLHLARLGVIAAALVGAAHGGAGPLLAGAGGLTAARFIAVRTWGRAP